MLQVLGLAIILASVLLINLPHYAKKSSRGPAREQLRQPGAQVKPAPGKSSNRRTDAVVKN